MLKKLGNISNDYAVPVLQSSEGLGFRDELFDVSGAKCDFWPEALDGALRLDAIIRHRDSEVALFDERLFAQADLRGEGEILGADEDYAQVMLERQ